MANNIIFSDGFDYYSTVLSKWDTLIASSPNGFYSGITPAIVAGAGRGGAGALNVKAGSSFATTGVSAYSMVSKNVGAQVTMFVGVALYFDSSTQTNDSEIIRFMDGSVLQVALRITAAGTLYFVRGTTVIGSVTAAAFPTNSFHYIEVQVTFNGSTGVANLWIDQTQVLTGSSLNTISSSNAFCNIVQIGAGVSNSTVFSPVSFQGYIDDIYFDTLGRNGDVRINGQLPTGNGTVNNFTAVGAAWASLHVYAVGNTIIDSNSNLQRIVSINSDFKSGGSAPTWATSVGVNTTDSHVVWVCLGAQSQFKFVNEPDPDGDSSYLSDSTLNDISRFTFPAIAASTIKTVIVWASARKDDGGFRAIQASVKSGATTATSGTDVPLGSNYAQLAMLLPTDPNTSTAWTASGVNGAEFGVKLTG